MDSEQHHYDLRSRSRSRSHTPMIFNQQLSDSEFVEHHYDLRSKESRERSHTPVEVSSSRRSGSRSLPTSAVKSRDQSMETITEQRDEVQQLEAIQQILEQEESDRERSVPPTKKPERRSERQRVKRKILTNGQDQAQDDQSVDKTTEHNRRSVTPKKTVTSDYSSEEGEREDPPSRPGSAYEIYKQAGDWWNVFPKTDYTYSQTSQCRYEIAPGVLAMPNMSRPSIHSDCSSACSSTVSLSQRNSNQIIQSNEDFDTLDGEINDTIEQNRLNEENARLLSYNMKRNSSNLVYKETQVEKFSRATLFYGDANVLRNRFSQVDSDTEVDEAISFKSHNEHTKKWRVISWFEQIKNIILMLFFKLYDFVKYKILRRRPVASHYQYQESSWSNAWNRLDYALQHVYLFLIKVLYLDSWLLSRGSNVRKRFLARRSKLIWLLLLPLLLITGCWLLSNAQSYVSSLTANILPNNVIVETKTNTIYSSDKVRHDGLNINNGATYDEMRRSIALLMERIDKLETSQINEKELMENITDSVDKAETREKDTWEYYNKKLVDLESKITHKIEDNTYNNELNNIKLEFNNLQNLYAQLKTNCDNKNIDISTSPSLSSSTPLMPNNADLEHEVEKIIQRYFTQDITRSEIEKIVQNVVIASNNVIHKNAPSTLSDFTTDNNNNNNDNYNIKKTHETCNIDCKNSKEVISLSEEQMKKIVKEVLKIYDADKTGRVDYALESAGGQVISIRCTQRYNVNTRAFKVLGFTLFYESGDPRTVIQGHPLQPGVCWAFQDFPGYLLIKLRSSIFITGFTLEHAPRSILPNNEIKSAPRRFNVWGLKRENDAEPVLFGEYEFLDNDESLQYFPIKNKDITEPYEYVELRIHSNHGQLEYTCLYRFRVHGIPR